MRSSLFVYALLLSGSLTSCFNPDLTGVTVTCDPPLTGACPDGQQCNSSGTCVASGTPTPGDMATTAILLPAEGCPLAGTNPGLGFDVTASGKPKVFACPVKYQKTADMQCKAPYVLCNSATNVDLAACGKAGQYMMGYFISSVVANKKFTGGGAATCGPPGNGFNTLWAGCGRSATNVACSGFTSALDCGFGGGSSFQCSGPAITDVTNSDGASGVLCCHP